MNRTSRLRGSAQLRRRRRMRRRTCSTAGLSGLPLLVSLWRAVIAERRQGEQV